MLKGGFPGSKILLPVGLCNQWSDRCRESYPQRHGNKEETITQGDGSQFCSTQLTHHDIIHQSNQCMTQHPQYYRRGQLQIVPEFFRIVGYQNAGFECTNVQDKPVRITFVLLNLDFIENIDKSNGGVPY